jgi:hypothetical protein
MLDGGAFEWGWCVNRRRTVGVSEGKLLFEVFGSDFIQRTGRNPGGGNAQLFRLGENFFVLQAEFL